MKHPLATVATILDLGAALAAISGAVFFVVGLVDVGNGMDLLQLIGMALLWIILPYCLAGSVHRIVQRSS